ncbi:MAG: Mur ligase domain-containing protein, partial [Smithella sp.]
MKLRQLLEGIDIINISGDMNGEVSSVCYSAGDCREDSMFVAVPGLMHDGHNFIQDAIDRGAKYIVHEKDIQSFNGVTTI